MKERKTIFFPFSPGIKWSYDRFRIILPDVNVSSFDTKLKNKNVIICSFGGLIECFASLAVLEMLNNYLPDSNLFWTGNKNYNKLIDLNGLAEIYNGSIKNKTLCNYPVPLFFDKNGNGYFNVLHNYYCRIPFNLKQKLPSTSGVVSHIIRNGLFKWDSRFLPKFRKIKPCEDVINKYKGLSRFSINRPFVVLIYENDKNKLKGIDWGKQEIKSFIAMMQSLSIQVVILSDKVEYFGPNVTTFPFKFDLLIHLLKRGSFVLSKKIDILFMAMMISNITIITNFFYEDTGRYSFGEHKKLFNAQNDILMRFRITPLDAFNYIRKKNDMRHNDCDI